MVTSAIRVAVAAALDGAQSTRQAGLLALDIRAVLAAEGSRPVDA
jgi:hypothetical protein